MREKTTGAVVGTNQSRPYSRAAVLRLRAGSRVGGHARVHARARVYNPLARHSPRVTQARTRRTSARRIYQSEFASWLTRDEVVIACICRFVPFSRTAEQGNKFERDKRILSHPNLLRRRTKMRSTSFSKNLAALARTSSLLFFPTLLLQLLTVYNMCLFLSSENVH